MAPMGDSFYNEKIDALLNLSMNSTQEERNRSQALTVGFDDVEQIWEVIVKFNGEFQELLAKFPSVEGVELLYQYAILRIPEELVDVVASDVQIAYMEKPKNLFLSFMVIQVRKPLRLRQMLPMKSVINLNKAVMSLSVNLPMRKR